MELTLDAVGARLPATLDLPKESARAGVVVLHGAAYGERSFFLYEHLARVLPAHGVAVLRFDRRPQLSGNDVPLHAQAEDAVAAVRLLAGYAPSAAIGLWGWSQGAWAASVAAAAYPDEVRFLVLVSSCGVSPARQMRFGTAEQLRRRGYRSEDVQELDRLRVEMEAHLRGHGDRDVLQGLVNAATRQPWFPHAYVDRSLPEPGSWADMDFDPEEVFGQVRCPVLGFYGETDEWMPIEESIAAWNRASARSGNPDVTLVRLQGCDHAPTPAGHNELNAISSQYTSILTDWLARQTGELESA